MLFTPVGLTLQGSGYAVCHPSIAVLKNSIMWMLLDFFFRLPKSSVLMMEMDLCPSGGGAGSMAGRALINTPALSQLSQPGQSKTCSPGPRGRNVACSVLVPCTGEHLGKC